MVEQLGLAIIRSFLSKTDALISGTISFFEGSILQADELSITVVPAPANFGEYSSEVVPPAEKSANLGFWRIASSIEITLWLTPQNSTVVPTLFAEATGKNSVTSTFLSSNTFIITLPTIPVAPTTAIFINYCYYPVKF